MTASPIAILAPLSSIDWSPSVSPGTTSVVWSNVAIASPSMPINLRHKRGDRFLGKSRVDRACGASTRWSLGPTFTFLRKNAPEVSPGADLPSQRRIAMIRTGVQGTIRIDRLALEEHELFDRE